MFTLPIEIVTVLEMFRPLFSVAVWASAQTLVLGALLTQGSRTVSSCLRATGLQEEQHFCKYHRVLNRAKWSPLAGAKILFGAIVLFLLPVNAPIVIGADETLERRRGKKIKAKGWYRDAVQSHGKHVVTCLGLEWLSLQLIVSVPWSSRPWGLPFWTILQPSKKANEKSGKRHKTSIDWTIQALKQLRRWAPTRQLVFLADGAFASFELLATSLALRISLVSRLRINARLYDFPPPPTQGKRGPKPKKGKKLSSLKELSQHPDLPWQTGSMEWYQQGVKSFRYTSSTALWHKTNHDPLPIRWVIVWIEGSKTPQAFFSNQLDWDPITILEYYMQRWNLEVTFEEVRAQLGVETQRQWSDLAIQRTIPSLMGLFSIVTLAAVWKHQQEPFTPVQTAWYQKQQVTFSDLMAWIRRDTWSRKYFNFTNSNKPKLFQQHEVQTLINQLLNAA
jgi:hypothetical protein